MSKLRDFLVSITPSYWLLNNPYNEEWDQILRQLLDEEEFVRLDSCTAKLGKIEVWVENHPYASFSPWFPSRLDIRPSRRTIARAYRLLPKLKKEDEPISAGLRKIKEGV